MNVGYITQVLQQCVQDVSEHTSAIFGRADSVQQHLQGFYRDSGALNAIAQRVVQSGALQTLASAWRLPVELASDLVKIALFDVVVLVDDSGSMAFEQNGERIEDLKS